MQARKGDAAWRGAARGFPSAPGGTQSAPVTVKVPNLLVIGNSVRQSRACQPPAPSRERLGIGGCY